MGVQLWQLEAAFRLHGEGIPFRRITSEETDNYNCIAHAAGDGSRWWWPNGLAYWPGRQADQELSPTLEVFLTAFATLGYATCNAPILEADHEKIALFSKTPGEITHAAFQLRSGYWTSKLGRDIDMEHELPHVEALYGIAVAYLRRPIVHTFVP